MDRKQINAIARKAVTDKHSPKRFHKHLITITFIALNGRQSIRDITTELQANPHKIGHLDLNYVIRCSTFSDTNKQRSRYVFGKIYMKVYQK